MKRNGPSARGGLRSIALALLAASIVSCAPSPMYRPRPPAKPPASTGRDTTALSAEAPPAIAISIAPPVDDFDCARITSRFGARRAGSAGGHEGIDIDAETGDEVFAAAAGRVSFAGHRRGYGNLIVIEHGAFATAYGHLFYATVRLGESVNQGTRIGRAGKRGRATGAHLHFELRVEGRAVDPMPYLCLDSSPASP